MSMTAKLDLLKRIKADNERAICDFLKKTHVN